MTIRAFDRQHSAALRAVSADPAAELRGNQLSTAAGPNQVNSPYFTLLGSTDRATSRGIGDALALLVRHDDPALHAELAPADPIERVMFDVLEQLRCQSLGPRLRGVRANLAAVSDAWCRNARANGVGESEVGLLIYTATHMARARLGLGLTDMEVDSIIEGPRARLGRLVGHALNQLASTASNQRAFAVPAGEIARLVAEMAADTIRRGDQIDDPARYRMLVPPEWTGGDAAGSGSGVADTFLTPSDANESLAHLGGYRAFTTDYDVVLGGTDLYRTDTLLRARAELDERVAAQSVSPQRLGLRLRRLLSSYAPTDFRFGLPQGQIDGRRLAQLVTTVDPQTLFRQPRAVPTNTTAVTMLVDNSGSMKSHRYETLAVFADTLSRALDLAGVTNEILGHTTNAWTGGRATQDWRSAAKPSQPGRVAELAHIIYKDAGTPWRRARRSLAAMLVTRHFRESVDGEAVIWAHDRLLSRPEPRKILVVVSDGAPAESGTAMAMDSADYLTEHLARVVGRIEQWSPVEIAALSIDGDVGSVFANSTAVDLDTTLGLGDYAAFELLVGS